VFKRRQQEQEPFMADHSHGAAGDNGLGVPPFRPTPAPVSSAPAAAAPQASSSGSPHGAPAGVFSGKDASMARPPFSTPSANPPMPGGAAPARATTPQVTRPSSRDVVAERRTLVVGRGISVQGMVQDAERLVVEGQFEASMIHATELSVAAGGMFKGEIEVEDAEITGTIDGTVTARGNLVVRSTGVVLGTARCRRLQVEDGGQITGRIEMITEPRARAAEPVSFRSAAVPVEA
jgi:cytoskeletal protein CcmA (bactofilin family)